MQGMEAVGFTDYTKQAPNTCYGRKKVLVPCDVDIKKFNIQKNKRNYSVYSCVSKLHKIGGLSEISLQRMNKK